MEMWEIICSIGYRSEIDFYIRKSQFPLYEQGLKISFHFLFSIYKEKREALTFIGEIIKKENLSWVTPNHKQWTFNLDELRKIFTEIEGIIWLKGIVKLEPDIFIDPSDKIGSKGTIISFYIIPEELKEDKLNIISPTTFISYAWENEEIKKWVKMLATQLRNDRVDVKLDQWELVPGDQMPHFMEKSVRENDYVLIICTPTYKEKSEKRIGGVGYEGDIMTAEVLQKSNHKKFIPILKSGTKETAIPSWLQGKYFVNLSNDEHFEKNYEDLRTTLLNIREPAPRLGSFSQRTKQSIKEVPSPKVGPEDNKIRIKGILVDEVTEPLNDNTRGSALYKIPFELNKSPSNEWIDLFINAWKWPPKFTSMHRSNIASVYGNKIILDGTTIEEVEQYHKDTLKLAVEVANKGIKEIRIRNEQKEEAEKRRKEEHKKKIEDISKKINFD